MIVDYIKEILVDYRNSISLENLEKILKDKGYKINNADIINHSKFFSLFNGVVFLKKSFLENKELFFSEFEDYIKNKITNSITRKEFSECIKFFIPDSLFTEMINIPLERKLLIFDLLIIIFVKPKRFKDKLKFYFSKLIDFYSLVTIYSSILVQNFSANYNKLLEIIQEIEPYEEILKNHLYNLISIPDIIRLKIDQWENEFNMTEIKLQVILENSFSLVNKYSPRLLKRVIEKETKDFNIFYLLTRFEYENFYNWILILNEEHETTTKHNLFDDLGI
jgi:hypothetical protein